MGRGENETQPVVRRGRQLGRMTCLDPPFLDDEPLNLDGECDSLSCSDLKVVVGNGVIGKFQRHPQCEFTRMPGALVAELVNSASRIQGLSQRRLQPIRDEPKRVQEIAFPRAISADQNR